MGNFTQPKMIIKKMFCAFSRKKRKTVRLLVINLKPINSSSSIAKMSLF